MAPTTCSLLYSESGRTYLWVQYSALHALCVDLCAASSGDIVVNMHTVDPRCAVLVAGQIQPIFQIQSQLIRPALRL